MRDREVHVALDRVATDPRLRALQPDHRPRGTRRLEAPVVGHDRLLHRRRGAHLPVACCRACWRLRSSATCHCWKVSEAGESVSVVIVIGMWAARASWLTPCTSGVAFWLLHTHTLISLLCAWVSTVCLSAALTSVPSAI